MSVVMELVIIVSLQ